MLPRFAVNNTIFNMATVRVRENGCFLSQSLCQQLWNFIEFGRYFVKIRRFCDI